jgi:hypothetical protein
MLPSMVCNGNNTEFCGGSNRLNLYTISGKSPSSSSSSSLSTMSTASSATPSATKGAAPAGWQSLGCYTDSTGARTLTNTQYLNTANGMTWEACTAACKTAGYIYSGLEYVSCVIPFNSRRNIGAPLSDFYFVTMTNFQIAF